MWGYDAAGTEVNQLAARQLVSSNQQKYSSILRRGLSSKSREFVQKVLEGMQHDKKARCLFVRAACWICFRATPHNSRLTAQAPLRRLRHGICVAKMLDNVGLRYPHRASGAKAPRTLRPLPLLRFAVSATGGAHLCSIQYYLRFWLGICRTSLAVSALRIMRYCLSAVPGFPLAAVCGK